MRQPFGRADDAVVSDAELIAQVRNGDTAVYAELVVRHGAAAARLGVELSDGTDPDVMAGAAFDLILAVLLAGGGPAISLRPYLLSVVRRLGTEDPAPFEPGAAFSGPAGSAFASLPERWQLVLWHLDAEGDTDAEVAARLGMSPGAIPAVADQAREGMRQALDGLDEEPDQPLRSVLGQVVLGRAAEAYLGVPQVGEVDRHLTRRPATALVAALSAAVVVSLAGVAVFTPDHGPARQGQQASGTSTEGPRADDTSRSAQRDVVSASRSATRVPVSAPSLTAARSPLGTATRRPGASPSGATAAAPTPSAGPGAADVSVAAQAVSMLPKTYDVRATLRGVPAGRTTSLVVQGTPGTVLEAGNLACSGTGSSRLSCMVGSGTTRGSFTVLNRGIGSARVMLTIAPVPGRPDPLLANNTTTLDLP